MLCHFMSCRIICGVYRVQVLDGTDPAELRDELREALPRSPKDQKVMSTE